MTEIFVDTAGWGQIIDSSQSHHLTAVAIYRDARQKGHKLITSNYIIVELVALLNSPLHIPHPQIVSFIDAIKQSPFVEIIHITDALDQQAWQLLSQRQDKNWSLVDCSSFVIMQQHGIREALTTDHHFEQAGFVALLV